MNGMARNKKRWKKKRLFLLQPAQYFLLDVCKQWKWEIDIFIWPPFLHKSLELQAGMVGQKEKTGGEGVVIFSTHTLIRTHRFADFNRIVLFSMY